MEPTRVRALRPIGGSPRSSSAAHAEALWRLLACLLTGILAVGGLSVVAALPAHAAKKMTVEEFVDKYKGERVSAPDGSYPGECVSLVKQYLKDVHGITAGAWGHAGAYQKGGTGGKKLADAGFKWSTNKKFQDGDILVWDFGKYKTGHIGISYGGKVFEQYNIPAPGISASLKTFSNTRDGSYVGRWSTGKKPKFTAAGPAKTLGQGRAYKYTFKASGRPAPKFGKSGTLPPGLKISAGGVLSGKPTKSGAYKFKVVAKNSAGSVSVSRTVTVFRLPRSADDELSTAAMTDGRLYSQVVNSDGELIRRYQLKANGAWSPWAVVATGIPERAPTSIAAMTSGRLYSQVVNSKGELIRRYQLKHNGAWSPWAVVATGIPERAPMSTTPMTDGRLYSQVVNSDGELIRRYQLKANGAWSPWAVVGTGLPATWP